jgi:hypothetical protein
LASVSARRDGSNIFGANINDKWKPLWSAGLGWKISEEGFYHLEAIPSLKLRVTYGYNGNVDLSKSAIAIGTYFSGSDPTNFPFARIQVLNNPELRWEKIGMLNFGLDFSTAREILSGSIEFYTKKGTDLYGPSPLDYTTSGRNQVIKNVADMKGHGVDVILTTKNINREVQWNTTILFNYNNNKTTKYFGPDPSSVFLKLGTGSGISPVIGKPLYGIAAYKWGGLDATGKPQGFIDGQKTTDYSSIKDDGIVYIGSSSPTVFGSLSNSVSWKHFILTVNVAYKLGYYFHKSSIAYSLLVNSGVGHSDFEKRWQKPGDEAKTNVPAFSYPLDTQAENFYLQSEVNVLKADHIRLQYINLSYAIQASNKKKFPFGNIELYVNAANLGILWKANNEGLDPDYAKIVPPVRTWAFGLRGNF